MFTEYSLRETDEVSRDTVQGAVKGTAVYNPLSMTDLKPWQGKSISVEFIFTFITIIIISSSCCYYLIPAGHELAEYIIIMGACSAYVCMYIHACLQVCMHMCVCICA